MSDHAEHGVDNPAFDGGTDEGCATGQDMSKAKRDDTGLEQKSPLLGSEQTPEEPPPPAEPVGRKSSTAEIARMFEHEAKRQSEKEGIREGFYTDDSEVPQRYKVDESDYASHRTTEFPHVHPILGSMHPVHLKKHRKISASSAVAPSLPDVSEDAGSDSEQLGQVPPVPYIMSAPDLETPGAQSLVDSDDDDQLDAPPRLPPPHPLGPKGEYTVLPAITLPSPTSSVPQPISSGTSGQDVKFSIGDHDDHHDDQENKLSFLNNLGQYQEPILSEPRTPRTGTPHVKFSVGSIGSIDKAGDPSQPEDAVPSVSYDERPPTKKKSTGHRKHSGHHKRQQELAMRRHRGSEIKMPAPRVPTEREEAEKLKGSDLAEMSAHRLHNIRGLRRHLISPNAMVSIGGKATEHTDEIKPNLILPRRLFDRQPHEMFVELDELLLTKNEEYEWQEKARWIKFEEDVEENLSRWGKPHVASLSFHSLLELRQCIESGVILLDLEEEDLPSIVTRLVDQLVTEDLLDPEQKGLIIRALLLKHRHVGDGGFALRRPSMASMPGERRPSMMNFFRSQSVVSNRSSPYVLRKADLNGSMGSNLNNLSTLPENSSSTSLPAAVRLHSHPERVHSQPERLNSQTDKHHDNVHIDINSEVEAQNVKNKMFGNVLHAHGHRVSFSTVPDVVSGDKIPMNEDDHSVMKDIHTIHTVAPPMKSRDSQVSLASDGSTRLDVEGGIQSNILRRIPKGAEATTVLVGNIELLSQPIMAFVRLSEGRILNNVTEVNIPVRFIFLLMGPSSSNLDYHEIGRSISTLMANTSFHDVAYRAEDRLDLLDAINEFLDESIVLPPGEWDRETLLPIMDMQKKKQKEREEREAMQRRASGIHPPDELDEKRRDPLKRTGMAFGGVIADIKERYPHYLSDLKDGLNMQCLSTFFFIYFACLSPAITFGGLLNEKVKRWMGVGEMLLACGCFGSFFALFAGQPITIVGFTGPLLVFEEGLFAFSESMGIDYMGWRFWALFWMCIITLVLVAFEGGILVKYITRFTEEIFALLIALIFIIETFLKLASIFNRHPLMEYYPPPWCTGGPITESPYLNGTFNDTMTTDDVMTTMVTITADNMLNGSSWPVNVTFRPTAPPIPAKPKNQPNTALLSLILCIATYVLATELKKFRNSKYLGRSARRALGDFGVPISILIFCLVDFGIKATYTEKLSVPDGLQPSAPEKRGWYISPLGLEKGVPVWAMFAAIIPGFLVFILVFMETQITSIIINKKERKLKKGSGFHLDMMLLGIWAFVAGIVGLPVLTAATVRSVAHVSSLSIFSRTHAPGEKPVLEGVLEQRVTGIAVHILMGLSLLLGPALRQVPLAVLFGVFLYMGISSLASLQFFDRFCILFMPRKYHGDADYVRRVKPLKMHLFTIIQVVCLGVLWAVKSTAASLAFPFFLILTIPLRYFVMKFMFTPKELAVLDNSGPPVKDDEDEADFYEQSHTLGNNNESQS